MTQRFLAFKARPAYRRGAGLFLFVSALSGCMLIPPDLHKVANKLRETTIKQAGEISSLKEQLTNRDATIATLKQQSGAATIPSLPQSTLSQLFTVSKIELRSSTDLADGNPPTAFRAFIRMYTADGQLLPATGTLTLEAFELPPPPADPRRIGTWTFTPEQMKKCWYSGLGLNQFAFDLPFPAPPATNDITFKARFVDALTGQTLLTQLHKNVKLPPPK